MTEMHDVVEMLLNRIKDYPEDFVSEPSQSRYNLIGEDFPPTKWSEALRTAYQVATDEEKLALDEATTDAKRAIYMGAALKTIMSDEYVEEPTPYKHQTLASTIGTMPISSTDKYIALMEQKQKEAVLKMRYEFEKAKAL